MIEEKGRPTLKKYESDDLNDALQEERVYIVERARTADDVHLVREFWTATIDFRWMIVGTTALFVFVAVLYSLLATEWYRSSMLLAPRNQSYGSAPLAGSLAKLSGLAGIPAVGPATNDTVEALAILQSRDFIRSFIAEKDLLPVLYADSWDPSNSEWKKEEVPPTMRGAVQLFREEVLSVSQDDDSGLVSLSVEWTDPDMSAGWAEQLVARLNSAMRRRAVEDAQANIRYLEEEVREARVGVVRESASRLIEIELQKLVIARSNKEYALRVIDSADVPVNRFKPKRTQTVLLSAILGFVLSAMVAFLLRAIRAPSDNSHNEA